MDLTSPEFLATAITALITGGVINALIGWIKDRKTVHATARLTDVQTLQAKLSYVEAVAEYLQKHNDRLQIDYEESEERNRKMRERVTTLETELDKIRRSAQQTQDELERVRESATRTQEECEALSAKLAELSKESKHGN